MKQQLKLIAQKTLPAPVHRWLGKSLLGEKYRPPVGAVDFGSLRRLTPISYNSGYNRGTPIDRYYIESFLAQNSSDVKLRFLFGSPTFRSSLLHLKNSDTYDITWNYPRFGILKLK